MIPSSREPREIYVIVTFTIRQGRPLLYLLDVEIDYAAMGERRDALLRAEHAHVAALVARGVVLVEWRKASGRGVYAIWNCASHEALRETIAGVPLAPYLSRVEVAPLVEHPLFPGGLPAPRPAAAP